MDALKELSWILVMILGPVLCVIAWQEYQAYKIRKARRSALYVVDLTEFKKKIDDANMPMQSFGFKVSEIGRAVKQAQTRKDDHTFKTVEEYRNELD